MPISARLFFMAFTAVLILSFSDSSHARRSWPLPEEELRILNQTIKDADKYEQKMEVKLTSMKKNLSSTPLKESNKRFDLLIALSRIYRKLNCDSSLYYASKANELSRKCNKPDWEFLSRLMQLNALSTEGLFSAVIAQYDSLGNNPVSMNLKIEYWMTGRLLYSYMRSYAEGNSKYYNLYNSRYHTCDDSLLRHLPSTSVFYKFITAERMVEKGNNQEAKRILLDIINKVGDEDNVYGMAAFQLAETYKLEGAQTEYAAWLAKSAVSDIRSCVKEGLALPTLADWLYSQGKLDEAFGYINFAMQDVNSANARMRAVALAGLVPHIDQAYRDDINKSRSLHSILILLLAFMFIAALSLLYILHYHNKKMKSNEKKLAKISQVQDSYIGSFIGLCSIYSERLESLTKLVNRKLAAGQSQELLKIMKSGKYNETEDDDFYKILDKAFLDLYPGFIENVNSLLREEEQITVKEPGSLTPELRIYAFVKLGVNESTKIAQILHYSVSTVYTYRNKMRNKAVDRENFDENVVRIGSPSLD